jgi:hypothetical protein
VKRRRSGEVFERRRYVAEDLVKSEEDNFTFDELGR